MLGWILLIRAFARKSLTKCIGNTACVSSTLIIESHHSLTQKGLITSQVEGCFYNFDRVNLKFHRAIIMKSLSKLETWRSLHIKVMELWSQYLLGSELRSDCLLGFWHLSECVLGTVFMCRNNYIRANTRISKIHPSIYLDAHPSICRGFLDCYWVSKAF